MADPLPLILSFHTSDLPQEERFSAWAEMASPTHSVTRPEADAPFSIDAFMCTFGDLILSHGRYTQQAFARTSTHIRRDHLDHFGLFAQGRGSRILRQGPDGREVTAHPGDLIFFDMNQPSDTLATSSDTGTIYLPRPMVEALLPSASDHHGAVLRGVIPQLVAHHLLVIGDHMMGDVVGQSFSPGFEAVAAPGYRRLVQATSDLALSCLLDTFGDATEAIVQDAVTTRIIPRRDDALRGQIIRFIDAHLTDPDLHVPMLCTHFCLSRSVIYRLFAESGGIARFIKRRRLARIRAVVLANQDRRPLADISADYGFRSPAHFNREFRAVFGYPPGDLRQREGDTSLQLARQVPALDTLFYALAPG